MGVVGQGHGQGESEPKPVRRFEFAKPRAKVDPPPQNAQIEPPAENSAPRRVTRGQSEARSPQGESPPPENTETEARAEETRDNIAPLPRPRFAFADPGPFSRPARKDQPLRPKRRDPQSRIRDRPTLVPPWEEETTKIRHEDWTEAYQECPDFGEVWEDVQDPQVAEWPKGYKIYRGKLLYEEKLCVPTSKVWKTLKAHHVWNAHQGGEKLWADIKLKYELPAIVDGPATVAKIRRHCLVCQACQAPNWDMRQAIAMTPIPPRVMESVALDVFSMPRTEWQGETYDAFLMCVDRHSGWMIAKPTQKH